MAMLNPPESLPHLAGAMVNYLLRHGEQTEEDLGAVFAPTGLSVTKISNTLQVGLSVGLFTRDASSRFAASEKLTKRHDSVPLPSRVVREVTRELILDHARDGDPWQTRGGDRTSGGRDIARALSWFLAQDAAGCPLSWTGRECGNVQHLQSRQLQSVPEEDRVKNDTRWGAFTRWAPFLGLARWADTFPGGNGLLPIPLMAIREVASEMPVGVTHPINDLLQHLALRLPVLERGLYRRTLDSLLQEQPDPAVRDGQVGSPIAQSLLILEAKRFLKLEREPDVERVLLQQEENVREVSHVVLLVEAGS